MKIAFFSENFYPELSGVSDSIMLLARELAHQGHTIRFYAPWYPARDYQKIHADAHAPVFGEGIDVVRLPSSPYPTGTEQGRLVVPLGWALRSLHRWRPDVIHVQQFYGVGLEAVLASRVLRIPLIGTVHESTSEFVYHSPIQGAIVTRLLLRYASWFYNRCRYVTAPSSFLFSQMISNGFYQPHRALSNPIDVDRFHPADASQRVLLRGRFGIRGPAIIYAGRLAPEKHVDTCLRAFARILKQVPDATLLISGYGSSEWALKELARNLSIESSVRFLGYLQPHDLVAAYQASDVFMVASTAEMQCLAMLQAMACRLPVIAVNAGGLPEYVPTTVGYLVQPGDVSALADKLTKLLLDPDLRQQFGARAFEYVQQFRPSAIAQQWLEIYEASLRH